MRVQTAALALLAPALLVMAGCGEQVADKGKAAPEQASPADAPTAPVLGLIDRSHAGEAAPAVSWEMKGGTRQTIADHKGMKMLVNLWATWCAPCVAEMPALDKLAVETETMILPLSQDMEGWQVVEKFWNEGKFQNIETGLDQPGSFGEAVKAKGLPVSILYDENGKEIWRVAGTPKWDSAEMKAALKG